MLPQHVVFVDKDMSPLEHWEEVLESKMDRSQLQHIYVQGCPGVQPRSADSSACPDCTPTLTVVDYPHPCAFSQITDVLGPHVRRFPRPRDAPKHRGTEGTEAPRSQSRKMCTVANPKSPLVLAYRCLDQTAPSYLQTLISPYTPTRPLRSACTRRLALPPLRSPASRARSFSILAPQWWNDLPTEVRTAQSLTTFRRLLKTHLFRQHL
ncbi:UNVERIFIED_CONTAM: hypothetical protein FKN15_056835 [Acipenser sinensis]